MHTKLSTIETITRRRLREPAALDSPGSLTVTPIGTTGATTWTYKLIAINAVGTTEAGAASSTTTGNTTLSASNYNKLTWTAVPDATGYWIYRTVAGSSPTTTGRIAILGAVVTYNDIGAAGDSTTAATTNTTGLARPFWSSDELIQIIDAGVRDLWRDIVDLKAEHYLTVDNTNVSMPSETSTLLGVPPDVHKIYLIEPRDTSSTSASSGLVFKPLDFNSDIFQGARSTADIDPKNGVIYYAIHGQGAPAGETVIRVAPQITSSVNLSFAYCPILPPLTKDSTVPIPGEADNALVAWAVAFARAKEREDQSPDPNWLSIYATEKQHLLQSLGLRQYQEPQHADAVFEAYWG